MNSNYDQPNILIIMPDQMRGDALSLENHPVLMTPNIDELGAKGAYFSRAYSTCASCIPARRSMLTGQFPQTNGMVGFVGGTTIKSATLPQLLQDGGYQTMLVGRYMHQHPYEEPYGFENRILGSTYIDDDDYATDMEERYPGSGGVKSHGISFNGWVAKPWHFDEYMHPTNWVTTRSREEISKMDDDKPFFMITSYYAPHPPFIPPAFYLDRYLNMELPDASIGDWAVEPENHGIGAGVDAHETVLKGNALRAAQAGYFALINHIDDQIFWLIADFKGKSACAGRPWLIIFTTDHGEMLGDHYFFRKCEPYEGSSRIPFLVYASDQLGFKRGLKSDKPVCLEDILPTCLDVAGIEIPKSVDGKSLAPVLRGEQSDVRSDLHAEHSPCYSQQQAYHFMVDHQYKYIWRPITGDEQFFDLINDPNECRNLINDQQKQDIIQSFRKRLVAQLKDRPEGFVENDKLVSGKEYKGLLDHA